MSMLSHSFHPDSITTVMSASLKPSSAVGVGQAYELLVLNVLRGYSFQLVHTGRPGDRGQDFFGRWVLPNGRVRVVGECKYVGCGSIHADVMHILMPLAQHTHCI